MVQSLTFTAIGSFMDELFPHDQPSAVLQRTLCGPLHPAQKRFSHLEEIQLGDIDRLSARYVLRFAIASGYLPFTLDSDGEQWSLLQNHGGLIQNGHSAFLLNLTGTVGITLDLLPVILLLISALPWTTSKGTIC